MAISVSLALASATVMPVVAATLSCCWGMTVGKPVCSPGLLDGMVVVRIVESHFAAHLARRTCRTRLLDDVDPAESGAERRKWRLFTIHNQPGHGISACGGLSAPGTDPKLGT